MPAPEELTPRKETKILPEHQHFRLNNGQSIQSLSQLLQFFQESSDEEFSEYVTHYKNDFAAWIYHTFHNESLSQQLAQASNRQEMIQVLSLYIENH